MPQKSPQKLPNEDIIRALREVTDNNADLLPVGLSVSADAVLTLALADPDNNLTLDLGGVFKRPGDDAELGVDPATELTAGKIRIATDSEAAQGTDDTTALSPRKGLALVVAELNDRGLTGGNSTLDEVLTAGNSSAQSLIVGKVYGSNPTAAGAGEAVLPAVWNPATHEFEKITADLLFGLLIQQASDVIIQALAARLAGGGSVTATVVTFGTHYEEVADVVAPYIIQYVISGQTSLPEGTTIHAYLTARYSDGSSVRNTSPVVWSINGGTPSGLTLTPTNNGAELDLTLGSINGSSFATLHAAIGGGYSEQSINLVDSVCTRPANLPLHVLLVYNYITSDGNAHLFSSLDDANNTMGRVFNEANIGISDYTRFKAELSNTNPGTDVYNNWQSEGDHSCAHVSDNNYYLLDGNGNDTVKLAVRVENGVIVTQKPSSYTTPAPIRITYQRQGDTNSSDVGGVYQGALVFLNEAVSHFEVQNIVDGTPVGNWYTPTTPSYFSVSWGNQAVAHTVGIGIRRVGTVQTLVSYTISAGNEVRPANDAQPVLVYTT